MQCKPLQATILLRFGAQQRWALADLASELGVAAATQDASPPQPCLTLGALLLLLGIATDVVRKNLSIWLNRGFISEAQSRRNLGAISARDPSRCRRFPPSHPRRRDGAAAVGELCLGSPLDRLAQVSDAGGGD